MHAPTEYLISARFHPVSGFFNAVVMDASGSVIARAASTELGRACDEAYAKAVQGYITRLDLMIASGK